MNRIKLAVIADDFTGGADAASFLKRKHANVVLLTGIPTSLILWDHKANILVLAIIFSTVVEAAC